jgi:CheY-like chemotaxis protein
MPKILAADATTSVLRTIHLAFQDTEFDIYTSDNGVQALEILMQIEPDAVVLGLSLSRKDGYEIARYLKSGERFREVPLILLVDAFDSPDPKRLENLKSDLILRKPFDSEQLVHSIRTLVEADAAPEDLPEEPEPLGPTPAEPQAISPSAGSPPDLESRIRDVVRREMGELERELEKRMHARLKAMGAVQNNPDMEAVSGSETESEREGES